MADRLVAEVQDELATLRETGPTVAQVDALVQAARRQRETERQSNSLWLDTARGAYVSRRYEGDVGATAQEAYTLSEARPDPPACAPVPLQRCAYRALGVGHPWLCWTPPPRLAMLRPCSASFRPPAFATDTSNFCRPLNRTRV